MLNRSHIQLCIMCLLITGTILSATGHPAQRRTLTLVDRLMRANPLRNLAKYFGQRLSLNVYYPHLEQPGFGAASTQTHYVKVPMWQPIYYSPQMAMIAPPMVRQQNPQVLHGFSYPVPQAMVQPAVSSYKPVMSEPLTHQNLQQNQGYYLTPPLSNQVSPNVNYVLPNGIMYPRENEMSNGEDSNSAGNMVRIIVIQPSELDKMKSMPESELLNGYTMKYIDLDDNIREPLTSQTQIAPQNDGTRFLQNQTCVEPLCDPFLRKLIPEFFPTSSISQVVFQSQENNQNQTLQTPTDNSDSFQDESSEEEVEDTITMVKAVENPELTPQFAPNPPTHNKKAISARINSTSLRKYEPKLRQSDNTPHYTEKVHNNVHKLTHNHLVKATMLSSPDTELIPSQSSTHFESPPIYPFSPPNQNFQMQNSYSYPTRYGTSMGKHRMAHYTAGVVFNKP